VRKLKLEMQVSLDGFALDVDGKTDWMLWNWGEVWIWDEAPVHTDYGDIDLRPPLAMKEDRSLEGVGSEAARKRLRIRRRGLGFDVRPPLGV